MTCDTTYYRNSGAPLAYFRMLREARRPGPSVTSAASIEYVAAAVVPLPAASGPDLSVPDRPTSDSRCRCQRNECASKR